MVVLALIVAPQMIRGLPGRPVSVRRTLLFAIPAIVLAGAGRVRRVRPPDAVRPAAARGHGPGSAQDGVQSRKRSDPDHRPALPHLTDLSAGGLRCRRDSQAAFRPRREGVRGVGADASHRLDAPRDGCARASDRSSRRTILGPPIIYWQSRCRTTRATRSRSRNAVEGMGCCGTWRQCICRVAIWGDTMPAAVFFNGPVVKVRDQLEAELGLERR